MKAASPDGRRTLTQGSATDLLLIAALWCASLLVIDPLTDFPLNDDWSYALAVKHLVEHGEFRPTGWTAMPLLTNALWGALFCLPAGFSFAALRLSTLAVGLAGILTTYRLVRELRQPRWLARLTSLTLAFSPIFYALSTTFMTDVPYTSLVMLAALFFVRHLRTGSRVAYLLGTFWAVAATLSRQLGVTVPAAFAISLVLEARATPRNFLRAVTPLLCCVAALATFQVWLTAADRVPAMYGLKDARLVSALLNPSTILVFVKHLYVASLYCGWFLLPVLLAVWGRGDGAGRRDRLVLTASTGLMLTGAVGFTLAATGRPALMPLVDNIIVPAGIGPLSLSDTHLLKLANKVPLPAAFWGGVTLASLCGAALLLATTASAAVRMARPVVSRTMSGTDAAGVFLMLGAALALVPVLVSDVFDRYFLPAVPLLATGVAALSAPMPRRTGRARQVVAAGILVATAVFAVFGTRDYLAWNRARWTALDDLITGEGVTVEDIDGGFEFNGYYLYDPHYEPTADKSWWWVRRDTYRLAFGGIPGYFVVKTYPYNQWLPPYRGALVVLKRDAPEGGL